MKQYASHWDSILLYTFLAFAMMVSISYGNSGSSTVAEHGRGGGITINYEDTVSLKTLQIERSLAKHRVGK